MYRNVSAHTALSRLEEPQEAQWCQACMLPSLVTLRHICGVVYGLGTHVRLGDCRILTLCLCRDCGDNYWKEYREAAE